MNELNHFDDQGNAIMVDVSAKDVTARVATAKANIIMQPKTLQRIIDRKLTKGDVLTVAQLAGIMAAKKTSDLIPLCHPLPISSVKLKLTPAPPNNRIVIEATCKTTDRTGVEMEALTAVSIAALTIYDMCKAIDRGMIITDTRLTYKDGGKSGKYQAD